MSNLIELLQNGGTIPKGTLERLILEGVFPISIKIHYNMYKRYCEEYLYQIDSGNKNAHTTSITVVSDEFSVSEMTIYRAIKRFESLTIDC